jgi:hypothetical protein
MAGTDLTPADDVHQLGTAEIGELCRHRFMVGAIETIEAS